MNILKRFSVSYKQHMVLRFFVQVLVLVLIYMSVRYWKSLDDIEGVAPMIKAQTLNGKYFDLQQSDKPVLIHFWAIWCPVCKLENASVASLSKKYQVITIASWSEGEVQVKKFMQEESLDMPVIIDSDGEWAKLYGVKAVPASFIVDNKGKIRFIEKGFSTETGLALRLWWLE